MTQIGANYGQALYQLAREESVEETVLQQLQALKQALSQEPEFLTLLDSPTLTKQERCGIVDDSFGDKVHIYVLNYLKLLVEKGYIKHFCESCETYRAQYNRDHGIISVRVVSAVPLREDQVARLTQKLNHLTGKAVELTHVIDPQCLGGIRLDYDGKQLDDTVSHRLESVRKLLKTTLL